MNLFEIDRAMQACKVPVVDPVTGEITGTEIDIEALEALEMERLTKIRNIACWIKNLRAEEDALEVQEKTFSARKKAARNKRMSLSEYLGIFLDGKSIKEAEFQISFRKTTATDIVDESSIPAEYLVEQAPKIDKAGILRALKAGIEIPGAQLKTSNSMTVK